MYIPSLDFLNTGNSLVYWWCCWCVVRSGGTVGTAEEPHKHDVRKTVARAQVLLQNEHHQQGARKAPYLPVREG